MTSKLTKYGIMIIAAVLLIGVVFAGSASADNAAQIVGGAEYATVEDAFYDVEDGQTIQLLDDSELVVESIDITGIDVTLDLNGYTLTEMADEWFFTVVEGATFTLMDSSNEKTGKLQGNGHYDYGTAGIYVADSTFIMENGSIVDLWSGNGAAVSLVGSIFNMKGGSIINCTADENGGAVYVRSGCTFNMSGDASIEHCNATNRGGAVYVYEGTFNMSGDASIEHCNAPYGGAVFIDGVSTFNMTGGSISNCNATDCGGAVYVDEGTFNMDGGSISYCNATNYGGAVYNDEGIFNMNGGSIGYCTADEYGGGVCNSALFNVSGTATITGNTNKTGAVNNVDTGGVLNLVGDFTGRIGIYYPAPGAEPVEFGTSESAEFTGAENFVADVKYDGYTYVGKINTSDNNNLYWTLGHIVTFEPMNGEDNWDKPVEDNTAVAQPENPEKKGYTFSGWYNGDSKWDFNTNVTEDMTLTAKWQKIAQKKSSGQSGSTIILTETPTPIATSAPVATSAPADVPTINPSVKPTTQQTQASPAPFVGLLAGLGAAAVLIRLRK